MMGVWRRSPLGRQVALTDPRSSPNTIEPSRLDVLRRRRIAVLHPGVQARSSHGRLAGARPAATAELYGERPGARPRLRSQPYGVRSRVGQPVSRPLRARFARRLPRAPGCSSPSTRRRSSLRRLRPRPSSPVARRRAADYFNPNREAMAAVLATIAAHCDGVRCDMAMLVLNDVFERTWKEPLDLRLGNQATEFWPEARSAVPGSVSPKSIGTSNGLQQRLPLHLRQATLDRLTATRMTFAGISRPTDNSAGGAFLENHDEARSAASPSLTGCRRSRSHHLATLPGHAVLLRRPDRRSV